MKSHCKSSSSTRSAPSRHSRVARSANRKISTKAASRKMIKAKAPKRAISAVKHSFSTAATPSEHKYGLTIEESTIERSQLLAVSPIDGRYAKTVQPLTTIFSEYALIRNRAIVELEWFKFLHNSGHFASVGFSPLSESATAYVDNIKENFNLNNAQHVKHLERTTRHDVKAVEYALAELFRGNEELSSKTQWLHFACTSEDITNLSYAMMLQNARREVMLPTMDRIINHLADFSVQYADTAMLSRTHGQTATPTTVGKEMGNFAVRLAQQRRRIADVDICGKFNGAVGNHNAHIAVWPQLPWLAITQEFVEKSLGIKYSKYSTQIEFHDYISELFDNVQRFNTILLDFDRDMWQYVSLNYWKLVTVAGEVGSSTMPHKVNPIDFENSEGNLGLANSTFHHLSTKLPISRFQRDLSDSTVLRNIGVGCSYSLIAYQSTLRGLNKITLNQNVVENDLKNRWELMAEPAQTFMRANDVPDAYERLKALTRGKDSVKQEDIVALLQNLKNDTNSADVERLSQLTPLTYVGSAPELARQVPDVVKELLQ